MKKLIIIDASAVIYKTFYALPPLINKKGTETGAIYGFLLLFFKVLKEIKPDFIVTVFDYPAPTFRHKKYKLYKAQRKKAPQPLYDQIKEIKEMLQKLQIKTFEKKGFEADDIIATIAHQCNKKNIETIIVSGDLDLLQLVNKKTKTYILRKGIKDAILYDIAAVQKRYQGLKPEQLADFRALRGDASDNIPGVPGIGEKTAITLLQEHSCLENILKQKKELKLKEKLIKGEKLAYLSQELAKIKNNVKINFEIQDCKQEKLKRENLIKVVDQLGFKTLVKRFSETENLKLF